MNEMTLRFPAGVLSGPAIEQAMADRRIQISPFDSEKNVIGPNSVDLHIADEIVTYDQFSREGRTVFDPQRVGETRDIRVLDPANMPGVVHQKKHSRNGKDGYAYLLLPGVLYLGRTHEETYCEGLVPWLDGRSSGGRMGLFVHCTAGRGDNRFRGRWTLEITVAEPLYLYPYPHELSRLVQVSFLTLVGEERAYEGRYQNQQDVTASRIAQGRPRDGT